MLAATELVDCGVCEATKYFLLNYLALMTSRKEENSVKPIFLSMNVLGLHILRACPEEKSSHKLLFSSENLMYNRAIDH